MRAGFTPWMMLLVISIMLLALVPASAATRLHGTVLAVTPKTGMALVHHDAFGSMPAMTMPFRILPRDAAARLQPGTQIDADVDTSSEPWTLTQVRSARSVALTANADGILRRVTPLHPGETLPETPFLDQDGRVFRFSQLRGHDVVLAFVYTRCQDARMCPLISAKLRQLQDTRGTRDLRVVEVSLDPGYDRPPVLRRYRAVFGGDPRVWTMLTGDARPVLDFAARFGIGAFPDPAIGIIHGENTVLAGGDGRIEREISETAWLPRELLAAIDASHGRASNPLDRANLWLSSAAVAVCGNSVGGFSGLADLAVAFAIFAVLAYAVYRLARKLFVENV